MMGTKINKNHQTTIIDERPINYKGKRITIEKARVLIKLKRGKVFPRTMPTRTMPIGKEIKEIQKVVDSLRPEEQDTYYYVRERGGNLYAVSYFNGIRSFVSEYFIRDEGYNGWKVYCTHEDGYCEYLKTFKTREEAMKYIEEH